MKRRRLTEKEKAARRARYHAAQRSQGRESSEMPTLTRTITVSRRNETRDLLQRLPADALEAVRKAIQRKRAAARQRNYYRRNKA